MSCYNEITLDTGVDNGTRRACWRWGERRKPSVVSRAGRGGVVWSRCGRGAGATSAPRAARHRATAAGTLEIVREAFRLSLGQWWVCWSGNERYDVPMWAFCSCLSFVGISNISYSVILPDLLFS